MKFELCVNVSWGGLSMKKQSIIVRPVSAYGRTEYRAACEVSTVFLELLGQKVLTERNIENIKRLGYRVYLKGGEL
jgi:hypothetical protein